MGAERLVKEGVEKEITGATRRIQPDLQLIAERHEFIDFGDDAALLSEGREGNLDSVHLLCREMFDCSR